MSNQHIRNFCIIAHIDHGKSTLADRFLELTKTVNPNKMHPQYLDSLDLEKEKQITIKLAPVQMIYRVKIRNHNDEIRRDKNFGLSNSKFILNLIDTPGHVDFSYEVSRSLAAVEGAILLVDAVKGIQAQTLAVLDQAKAQKLAIIPVINKIDLELAETEKRQKELSNLLGVSLDEVLKISAKNGVGIEKLLKEIIIKIPAPAGEIKDPFKALIFDSVYDSYRGVIVNIRVFDGLIKKGDQVKFITTDILGKVTSVGIFKPEYLEKSELSAGEIGYLISNIKDPNLCQVGDTITLSPISKNFKKLPGYQKPKPNVFVSLFLKEGESDKLKVALSQLQLNDSALEFKPDLSPIFGSGFRCGFLGMLHLEIIKQRLEREHHFDLILNMPSVSYNIITKGGEKLMANNPDQFPASSKIKEILQPEMLIEIIIPSQYLGPVSDLLKQRKAKFLESKFLEKDRVLLTYEVPLSQIIWDFFDQLKSVTSGMGSFGYHFIAYRPADLVKLDVMIAGEKFSGFSQIIYRDNAFNKAKEIALKIKKLLPRQLFEIKIQACVDNKILASEKIPALRKDVTAKLYGGDRTRKDKLLKKQKKGKKKMRHFGRAQVPGDIFWKMFK